ncbi:MAG: hypothetical protein MEQ74_00980 [Paracoccus sp.]|nr:hypothetical protein [Paracoccus sp. (in: a-proteobacteria)]
MAVSVGTMARLKNGGAWSFFPGGPETAVEAFGPGVEIEIRTVGEVFDLETLPAVSAPNINQPDPIVVPFGTGFTDNMAARVSGGVPPYTFSQVQAAPLPLGVTITAGGNLTGSNQFPVGGYGWSVRVTDSRVTDGEDDPQSATINYLLTVEALPQVTPHWVVTSDQRAIIDGVTAESGIISFTLTEPAIYAGTHTVDTAQLAAGPVCLVPPSIVEATQNPGFVVMIPGLWVSLSETITIDPRFVRDNDVLPDTGLSFDIYPAYEIAVAADGGKTLYPRETATDANGARSAQPEAGYFVEPPVSGIANGVTDLGTFSATQEGFDREIAVSLGAADPAKVISLWIAMEGNITSTSVRFVAGGVEYPMAPVITGSAGNVRGRLYEGPVPAGGAAVLRFTQAVSFSKKVSAHLLALKNVTRKSAVQLSVTATAGTPIAPTVNVAANDYAVLSALVLGATEPFSGTTFGQELSDTEFVGATSPSRFYLGLGQAASANAAQPLSVTPGSSGSAVYLTAVYGA